MKAFLVYTNGKIERELYNGSDLNQLDEFIVECVRQLKEDFGIKHSIHRVMSDYRDIVLIDFGSHSRYLEIRKKE